MRRIDGVADVSGKQLDVACRRVAQIDAAKFFTGSGVDHLEVICRNMMNRMRREGGQFQFQLSVRKASGIDWSQRIRHAQLPPDATRTLVSSVPDSAGKKGVRHLAKAVP